MDAEELSLVELEEYFERKHEREFVFQRGSMDG